jgi:hypothetical protein
MSHMRRVLGCVLWGAACSDDTGGATTCDGDCMCGAAACATADSGAGSGSGSGAEPATSTGSDDAAASTTSSPGGDDSGSSGPPPDLPAFSMLPPYGVLGATWTSRQTAHATGDTLLFTATVSATFVWPDGAQGSTIHFEYDDFTNDNDYAIYDDRIEVRQLGEYEPRPHFDLFRVPMEVGDSWQTSWQISSFPVNNETWTLVAEEDIVLEFGTFPAARLEWVNQTSNGSAEVTYWVVDGMGLVRSEFSDSTAEMISFTLP